MNTRRRIAVAGGGTAGHVAAGVAILQAYREECGAEGYFIGCVHGMEAQLVPGRGEEIHFIAGSPYEREGWPGKLTALVNGLRGVLDARPLLRRMQTELVIGVGGYASVGAALAARSMGIPLVLHEANAQPGKANKLLARYAARVCLGFAEAGAALQARVVCHTGNPVGAPVRPAPPGNDATLVKTLVNTFVNDGCVRFLVTGGSEGSPFLNRHAPAMFKALAAAGVNAHVHHMTGHGDAAAVRRAYQQAGVACHIVSFSAHMEEEYAAAGFVLACAGAITLAEIAAAELPCLLVPLSGAAAAHQNANARAFSEQTGARWVTEQDWAAPREADWIASVIRDPDALAVLRSRTQAFARPDAARAVVRVCEELLGASVSTPQRAA
jgi:UDP-N-acetylglucosamine--N-acetylmuramyl-(pentapeptide) pyrophosphoryl-undecaprenol N-acetylglucosamine transferase